MNNALINNSKSYFLKNGIWIVIGMFMVMTIAYAIVNAKWLYLGVLLVPFLIYFYFKNAFVFFFGLYAFLIPSDSLLLLTGVSGGQAFTKYLAILIILVLCMKGAFEEKFKKPDTIVIWWILLTLYCILTLVWAIKPELAIDHIRNIGGLLILYLVVSSYKVHKKDYEMLKWCIIAGGFLSGLLSIYSYQTLLQSAKTVERVAIHIGDQTSGLNDLAFCLLFPFSAILGKVIEGNKIFMKVMFGFVLITILSCIVLSGSRGAQLGVGVIFVVHFLFTRKKVTFLTIFIPLVILTISLAPSFLFERWGTAVETGGAGRMNIWYVGLKALGKYWLTGAGIYNFPAAYTEFANYAPEYEGLNRAPHNIYLGMIVELGIIGFTLIVLVFIRHYKAIQSPFKSGNYDFDSIMLKASFWSLLVSSFFLDTFWDKSFWLLWMMIMIHNNVLKNA